jgi:hypothetical protein
MPHNFEPLDLSGVSTYSISERKSKVNIAGSAVPWVKGGAFDEFLSRLPRILAGANLEAVISAIAAASRSEKTVIVGMGAHVIKVGLSRVIIDLMERGVISAVAMNGAGLIHDLELAMSGSTSEDVDSALENGTFGMARETCSLVCEAIASAERRASGLGRSAGMTVLERNLPYPDHSILAAGARLNIPVTIHVAVGTDIVHMHPQFDPARAGAASHVDFRVFSAVAATLEAGVFMNVGSAVILPEVFLKAITLARNLGHRLDRFTTVNLDFISHYRPLTNVVRRPTSRGGRGYNLVGHHEILLPLIAAGVIERIDSPEKSMP